MAIKDRLHDGMYVDGFYNVRWTDLYIDLLNAMIVNNYFILLRKEGIYRKTMSIMEEMNTLVQRNVEGKESP